MPAIEEISSRPMDREEAVRPPADPPYAGYDLPEDPTLEIDGPRSLATIGLHAFWLGFALAASSILGVLAAYHGSLSWRLCAFITALSIFHFLEYWTTARFNLPVVRASSFLLFSNGAAYNIAYGLAVLEIAVSILLPGYAQWLSSPVSRIAGLLLVLLGQVVRSVAMAHAGKSFNHTVQKEKKQNHTLVTTGIYSYLRHPSYFGFYYWAIGTQLLVGNKLCVLGYAVVLWRFFSGRIAIEERQLIAFFGADYTVFKAKTTTALPFIR